MCDPCSSSAVLRASISVYPNLDPNRFPNMALYQKVTPLAVLEFHFIHGVHLLWGRAKRRENCRLHCTALHSTVHTQMVCGSGMPKFCRRGRRRLARTTTNGRKTREGGRPDRERERERGGNDFSPNPSGVAAGAAGAAWGRWPLSFARSVSQVFQFPIAAGNES